MDATPIFDHVNDTAGTELVKLASHYEFPDFVKSAGEGSRLFNPPSAPGIYADDDHKLYPCHNPASAWLSAVFFHDKKAEYREKFGSARTQITEMRLNQLVETWKIKEAVDAIFSAAETNDKTAEELVGTDYAINWTDQEGQQHRQLRLANDKEVKAACVYLITHRKDMTHEDRMNGAAKVLDKAAEWDVDLGQSAEHLRRMAGQGICNPTDVVEHFRIRQKLANSTLQSNEIKALADTIESRPAYALQPEMLPELLKVAEEIDEKLHLVGNYSEQIKAPADVIFATTYASIKSALDDSVVLLSGSVYSKESMASLPLEQFRELFGDDLAQEVSHTGLDIDPVKMAEVAPTLPLPDARMLERLCADNGIYRIHAVKTAAVTAGELVGMTRAETEELARTY